MNQLQIKTLNKILNDEDFRKHTEPEQKHNGKVVIYGFWKVPSRKLDGSVLFYSEIQTKITIHKNGNISEKELARYYLD